MMTVLHQYTNEEFITLKCSEGENMRNKQFARSFYNVILYVSSFSIILSTILGGHRIYSVSWIYFVFIAASIIMGFFAINSGMAFIDLTDSVLAFMYITFGIKLTIIFILIYWVVIGIVDKMLYHRHRKGIVFNISMMTLETYFTSVILNLLTAYLPFSNTIFLSASFMFIFLTINICLFKLDHYIIEGIDYKLSTETKKLIFINFVISFITSGIFLALNKNNNYSGMVITLIVLVFAYYFFFLYRKLQFRGSSIKKLIKITCEIVKYGDFNEKCNHLLKNLKELIPYEVCAIYTFDTENDGLLYPISYASSSELSIGDLTMPISEDSITDKVIKEGKIYISKDFKKDKKINASGKLYDITESAVLVPISADEKVIGFITINGKRDLRLFIDNGVEDILSILSNQMALAIENDNIYRNIRNEADIDYLTNFYNRRAFDEKINHLISTNTMFSMVIFDIDDFKNINDTFGHLAGDETLRKVCSLIKKSIRKTDIACRYGGEELVILFSDLSKEDAFIISDRIREKVRRSSIEYNGIKVLITVSGGIANFPEDGKTKEEIIGYADEVLYNECKNKGKNKVCAYRIV